MILNRAPFYFNVVFPNTFVTNVNFTLVVGTGSTTTIVPTKTYTFTKQKPSTSSTNTWLDISPYIRDYYSYTPIDTSSIVASSVIENDEVLLASISAQVIDSLGSTITPTSQKYICADGYGYYREGQNSQPTNKILLTHQNYRADARGWFIVPLRCISGDANPTVNGVAATLGFVDNHNNYVKYLIIPCSAYTGTITVVFGGESIDIELIEECIYDVNEVQFINRYGVFENMHFYKASKKSIETSGDDFKNNFTNGVSYDVNVHQKKKINVMSNESITVETGFLNPYYNETISELLQSENVWLNGIPVNVVTSSLEYKTRIVDKLISYSLDFEYAFDRISNI